MMALYKRIGIGALIAELGAFIWANIIFGGEKDLPFWQTPFVAGYAVLITSWFVFPIGGVLGAIMPSIARNCSVGQAFVRGAMIGLFVGLIAAVLTTILMHWSYISGTGTIVDRQGYLEMARREFTGYAVTMIPFCVVWVGIWAWFIARKTLAQA